MMLPPTPGMMPPPTQSPNRKSQGSQRFSLSRRGAVRRKPAPNSDKGKK